ncbi:MAG: efflux RND transporter permease subunit [Proteobacteria bacterium]|nr:efflux RND transporter permease subunit [Pseudomonadota bacterium]
MRDAQSAWRDRLPSFSLDRRISVLVLAGTTIVVGIITAFGLPLELVPRGFEQPSLRVRARWRDAPPQEVLDKILLPLEEELSTVRGLSEIDSRTMARGGRVSLSFKQGTDMDVAYREVRDRIERAKARLPSDVERVRIEKHDASGIPIMMLGLAVDPELKDPYELIQKEVVLPLSRVDGVATVSAGGLQQKEILIELDRSKTAAAGLNIYQLAQDLARDNFSLASGTVREGERKLLLRSLALFPDLSALRWRLVSPSVRLQDVADVRYAVPELPWRVRVNSKPALALRVMKEGQANTIAVSRALRQEFQRLSRSPRLQGLEMAILFSQGAVIRDSLDTLVTSGLVGGVFAIVVLFFFLLRFRMTLVITLSIPLSMLIAIAVMYFAGETFNVLSLLGLIISVGLLVDNSVVVAENVHRLHQSGTPLRQACIRGAGQIALAIVLATLTTVVVFLPVSLVEGKAQFLLLRLSFPVCVSLIASLFVALLVVPLGVYMTLGKVRRPQGGLVSKARAALERVLSGAYRLSVGRLGALYVRLLAFFLRRRLDLVLLLAAVFVLTVQGPGASVGVVPVSDDDRRTFEIEMDLPGSLSVDDAAAFFAPIERALERLRPELGLEGYLVVYAANWGKVEGWLPAQAPKGVREARDRVIAALPDTPGVKYYTGTDEEDEEKKSSQVIVLLGDDHEQLAEVGAQLRARLSEVDGVVGVKRWGERTPNELGLLIDRERAQWRGVSPRVIAAVVGYALRGQSLPRIHRAGSEIPVRIRFREQDRDSLEKLEDFAVPTASGQAARLSALTHVEFLRSPKQIFRRGKRIAYRIALDLKQGEEDLTRERIAERLEGFGLPEGIVFGSGDSGRDADEEDMQAMRFAGVVSVLFIYLLIGFLFESFVLPLSVLVTIPLASVGVIWLHFATGRDVDFLGAVGAVLLIGVVVNNGIVLVDYINRLRREGRARTEALLLAAERRFRPILMTAGTTVCGMLPVTLGDSSSMSLSYKSFGLTLIGGLTTATVLTLLVVPVFYTLFDDARAAVGATVRAACSTTPRASSNAG